MPYSRVKASEHKVAEIRARGCWTCHSWSEESKRSPSSDGSGQWTDFYCNTHKSGRSVFVYFKDKV